MLDFTKILEEANKKYSSHVVSGPSMGSLPTHVSKEVEIMGRTIVEALNKAINEANEEAVKEDEYENTVGKGE